MSRAPFGPCDYCGQPAKMYAQIRRGGRLARWFGRKRTARFCDGHSDVAYRDLRLYVQSVSR